MKHLYCLALFVIVNIFNKHLTVAQTAADPPLVAAPPEGIMPVAVPLAAEPPTTAPAEKEKVTLDNSKILQYLRQNGNDNDDKSSTEKQTLIGEELLTTHPSIKLNSFGFHMPSFFDRLNNKPEPTAKPAPQVTTTASVNKPDEKPQRPFYGGSRDENDIENELAESGTIFKFSDKTTTKAAATTAAPTTPAPTTRKVTTAAPTTPAPTTRKVTTAAPTTPAPTTRKVTTAAPTTQAPKPQRPAYGADNDDRPFGGSLPFKFDVDDKKAVPATTAAAPTTAAPTTRKVTTAAPTTPAPTTPAPTTRKVTTAAPTTPAPTTRKVTTASPTTEAPKPQRPVYGADNDDRPFGGSLPFKFDVDDKKAVPATTAAAPTTAAPTTAAQTTEAPKPEKPYGGDDNDGTTAATTVEASTKAPFEQLGDFFKNLNFAEGSLLKQNGAIAPVVAKY